MKKHNLIAIITALIVTLTALTGCSLPGLGGEGDENTVVIGSSIATENQILAGALKELIEHETPLKVTIVNNLGTSMVLHQAQNKGEIDISSCRYTGTDIANLMRTPPHDPDKALQLVQETFLKKYHATWFPSYGFDNTYAFMVTPKTAEKYQLKTLSDLKKAAPQMTVGVDSSWLNRKGDGYQAFIKKYDLHFKKVVPMQIGLVYDAVNNGKMDMVLGYSTDGRIASYHLKMLKDDKQFFPPYDASMVVNTELLQKHPELKPLLLRLANQITTKEMQQLNYEADNNLEEPEMVGANFVKVHHYFTAKEN